MTEPVSTGTAPDSPADDVTAGSVVRAAREARGQSLQHLSIVLKISERRLQAFEDARWDKVGDRTFVRALAQRLCRHLDLDPQPVLQALPVPLVEPLRTVLRNPVRAGDASLRRPPARLAPMDSPAGSSAWITPVRLGVVGILLAAGLLGLLPLDPWWPGTKAAREPEVAVTTAAEAAPAEASAPSSLADASASAAAGAGSDGPSAAPAPAAATLTAPAPAAAPGPVVGLSAPAQAPAPFSFDAAALQVSVQQDSWVLVTDAQGAVLLSRLLRSGERVGLDGSRPLRMRVGNAAGTEVIWLGRRVALDELQRNNVADVDLP
jgi:cytoskeleton protein RodZ